ncbi:hypothetical protein GQ53DRAFT_831084 [Thozetella sp. PMI_491]|nr:hypothetical protein GQ53DRAFT_831084 [Thozetella sp. PMI_491]
MDSLTSDWELLENPWDAMQESLPSLGREDISPDQNPSSDYSRLASSVDLPKYHPNEPLDSLGTSQLPGHRSGEDDAEHPPTRYETIKPSGATGAWSEDKLPSRQVSELLDTHGRVTAVDDTQPDLLNPWNHGEEVITRNDLPSGEMLAIEIKHHALMVTARAALAKFPDEHKSRDRAPAPVLPSPPASPTKDGLDRQGKHTVTALPAGHLQEELLDELLSEDPWGAATLVSSSPREADFFSSVQRSHSTIASKQEPAAQVTATMAKPKVFKPITSSRGELARASSPQPRALSIRARTSGLQYDVPPDMIRHARPPRSFPQIRGCAVGKGSPTSISANQERGQNRRRRQRVYVDVLAEKHPYRT